MAVPSMALIGAALYIGCWFSGFLFGGFLIPVDDIVWRVPAWTVFPRRASRDVSRPLRAFHYLFPMGFGLRSMTHSEFADSSYDSCTNYPVTVYCYCQDSYPDGCGGREVLRSLSVIYPLINPYSTLRVDLLLCLVLALAAKAFSCVAFVRSARGATLTTKP